VSVVPVFVKAVMVKVLAVHTPAYCHVVVIVPPAETKVNIALLDVVRPLMVIDLVPETNVV
jgi:hypothetical protein